MIPLITRFPRGSGSSMSAGIATVSLVKLFLTYLLRNLLLLKITPIVHRYQMKSLLMIPDFRLFSL